MKGIGAREVVGVELCGDELRIAHVIAHPSKKEVMNLLNKNISGLDEAAISKIISTSLSEFKVKNPLVVDVLPSHVNITKNI